jgi:hypothetical protein
MGIGAFLRWESIKGIEIVRVRNADRLGFWVDKTARVGILAKVMFTPFGGADLTFGFAQLEPPKHAVTTLIEHFYAAPGERARIGATEWAA